MRPAAAAGSKLKNKQAQVITGYHARRDFFTFFLQLYHVNSTWLIYWTFLNFKWAFFFDFYTV